MIQIAVASNWSTIVMIEQSNLLLVSIVSDESLTISCISLFAVSICISSKREIIL